MMKKSHSLITIIALLQITLCLPTYAEQTETGSTLLEQISRGWSYQLRIVGFGMITEPADSSRNPDNRIMNLPRYTAAMQLRPDFRLDLQRLALSLQPRAELYWEAWTQGQPEDEDKWRDATFIQQWLARWSITDELYVSYGRENLQWGPAYLTSLSNPFYEDNGKSNPKAEVATMDFARMVWVPSLSWSVSLIVNTDPGRVEMDDDEFTETYALKTDYMGSANYGSLILTYSDEELKQISGFWGSTMSDALLLYGEGVLQCNPLGLYPHKANNPLEYTMATKERQDDTWIGSFLAGAAYTLESGPTLTLEYLYYGAGYDNTEAEHYFELQDSAAREIETGTALTPLSYDALSTTADPDLRFLRRNYLLLQYVHTDIVEVVNLTLRWTQNLDDGSSRWTSIVEWFAGDHVELFTIGTLNNGTGRSEFDNIIDYQVIAGIMYIF